MKTSTGFSTGGATKEDIALMRKTVGSDIGVKASGGVRTKEDVDTMVEAGASRIGASAGVSIVKEKTHQAETTKKLTEGTLLSVAYLSFWETVIVSEYK